MVPSVNSLSLIFRLSESERASHGVDRGERGASFGKFVGPFVSRGTDMSFNPVNVKGIVTAKIVHCSDSIEALLRSDIVRL